MSDSKQPLTPIAQVEILGEKFDIARNGGYHLVRVEEDDYGQPRASRVDLVTFLYPGAEVVRGDGMAACDKAQALLDVLGKTLEGLRSQRDARLGIGREGGE
jgi:hypothetical protein